MRRMQWIAMVLLPALGGAFVFGLAPIAAQPGDPATADNPQASQVHVRYLPNVESTHLLEAVPVSGALADGGTFSGWLTVTGMGYDTTKGLTVDGVLTGLATTATGATREVNQRFSGVAATLNETAGAGAVPAQLPSPAPSPSAPVCDILFLDLGPLFLDLLGLTVDLAEVILDINAVPGAGNLLGNLLCAVAGLLDPGGLLGVIGNLQQLLGLLTQLNQLLNLLNGLFP
jgi:hypothetical protein